MDFSGAINRIMPDVQSGSTEPFIIYRDSHGGWHGDHTQNQYGEQFDWVEDVPTQDPLALVFSGKDFAGGSYPSVYDKVLSIRVYLESVIDIFSDRDTSRINALANFFKDNVGAFSHEATDYLTTLERPLAALAEMCPLDMTTEREDWKYNEDLAADAIDQIESAVRDRLHINVDKPEPERQALSEYKELNRISVNQSDMILSENPDAEYRYMVIENRYTPYYNNLGNNNIFTGHTNDYLEAIDEFSERVQYNIRCFKSSWEAFAERDEEQDKQKSSPAKKHTLQEKLDNAKQKAAMNDAAKNNNRGDKPKTNDGRE